MQMGGRCEADTEVGITAQDVDRGALLGSMPEEKEAGSRWGRGRR